MNVDENKINILKKKEKEAFSRIVDLQLTRTVRNLSTSEKCELAERRAYYNGLCTVLEVLGIKFWS